MDILNIILGPAFSFLFIGVWCFILFQLSKTSGWARLAEVFECKNKINGNYYNFQSAHINNVQYSGSLKMGISKTGLVLVPIFPFRIFHKRVLVPWEHISAESYQKSLVAGYSLSIANLDIQIIISDKQFERMSEFVPLEK